MRRLEYFRELRAYPFDRVPAGALQAAYRQIRQRWPEAILLPRVAPGATSAANLTWNPLGPSPISTQAAGRISSIAIHPTNRDVLYIGAAQGGVWKSTDGGTSWVPLTDGECSLAMGSIAIDPVNPDILYAGTGELHFSGDSYYGCGILRSTDGGTSWTQLGADVFDTNTVLARISKVIVDPPTAGSATTTTVYAASSLGVHRSADSGLTWTRLLDGIATDLVQHPSQPAVLWAAIGSPAGGASNGVYRSTDAGLTWVRVSAGFANSNAGRIALGFAPSSTATIYAAVQDAFGSGGADGTLLGIWRTIDGVNWTRMAATSAECGGQCWYDLVIATDPLDTETVYFGGIGLYRSTDGATSFQSILADIHVDQHAIAFDPLDPATVFVANDGGIYRSTNRGNTWVPLNGNLTITQFYSGIALHPTDTTVVLGGTQDNGTLEFAGTPVWNFVLNGDGGYTAIDPVNPGIAYAETQWQQNAGFSGPRRRDGPGFFAIRKVAGIDFSDRALFIPPLVMDPVDPRTLYFGTFRIYRTTNSAELWTVISPDLTRTSTGRISAIAASTASSGTLYVGTSDGHVQVTRDGGGQWDLRTNGFPNRPVMDIAIDAADPAIATAVVSGFGTGHVLRTTDFGVTWQDISGNLPDVPVNAVLTDPALGSEIYIGTDLGTFRTGTLGTAWEPFQDGLPNVAVFDLAYNAETGIGIAATHGRGMFSFRASLVRRVIVTPANIAFTALADSIRLTASLEDSAGVPVTAFVSWRSLDAAVATVKASGTVVAHGNGTTIVVASAAGVSDSTTVLVDQVPVSLAGLRDSTELVQGEAVTLDANPIDANGFAIADPAIAWTSSSPATVSIDASGLVTAIAVGTANLVARLDTLRDSTTVRVLAPSITTISADRAAGSVSSSALGTRVPLLRIHLSVAGPETVELTRLGFLVEGDDPDARLQLVVDEDADGRIDEGEPLTGNIGTPLRPGEPVTARLSPDGLTIAPDDDIALIVALRMSGRAPNGATFQASFLPAETGARNVRSGAIDAVQQPGAPVASDSLRTTVLVDDQLLTVSENPVRSSSLIFNFIEAPVTAAVYTVGGRLVANLLNRIDAEGRGVWDLRNDEGAFVAPGLYLIVFHVRGQVFRERLLVLRRQDEPAHQP